MRVATKPAPLSPEQVVEHLKQEERRLIISKLLSALSWSSNDLKSILTVEQAAWRLVP